MLNRQIYAPLRDMQTQKVLFIGLVWPEPQSSAAGTHLLQVVHFFLKREYEVHFACAAQTSPYSFNLSDIGVHTHPILLNDSSFDLWIAELQPNMVVFDRFVSEEQYGWRVRQECADAICILDTEDLHFLRKSRQKNYKINQPTTTSSLFTDDAKRELAAILRCDLSLIISTYELDLLVNSFKINPQTLVYLPFLAPRLSTEDSDNWPSFLQRQDFAFIGNFLHEPNWHAVQTLKTTIWPLIHKRLPQAKMQVYGAYTSPKVLQLENKKEGFLVNGRATDARQCLVQHKLLLAPICFGAGLKGKIVDAMQSGTPNITTTLGAEGMQITEIWPGAICDNWNDFAEKAIEIYQNEEKWYEAQGTIIELHNTLFDKEKWERCFEDQLNGIKADLKSHRAGNFMGEILKMQQFQSTKYLSLWIEEKNKNAAP